MFQQIFYSPVSWCCQTLAPSSSVTHKHKLSPSQSELQLFSSFNNSLEIHNELTIMKQQCVDRIVRNISLSLFTPSQLLEYMIMFHRYRSCMLRDAIIINLNLKLININLPLWDCSGIIQNITCFSRASDMVW